jgi:predicted lipoprotein with Yx(FWY)xxD motif
MSATLRGPSGVISLDETVLTIGRSRQNRLVFTHNQVSSKHAEVQPLGMGRYQVVDVGSSNGTSLNGMRLATGAPRPLNDGDVLRLGGVGGVELTFELSAAPIAQPVPVMHPQVNVPLMEQAYVASPPPPQQVIPIPPPPMYPYGQPEPPRAPAPTPMPMAISNVARYKRPPKVFLVAGGLLLLVLLVVGIGLGAKLIGGTASPQQTGPVATGTATPGTPVVQTAKATVEGKETTILTTPQGLTLYYFTPDTATTTACTGDCIANWPPLLFDGAGALTAPSDLSGTLSIQTSDNGAQVAYNGHPLYTFSGDTAPGQTNGEGKNGKWFIVTPDLEVQD